MRKTGGVALPNLLNVAVLIDRIILNMAGRVLSRKAGTAFLRRFPSSGKCSPNMCRYRGQCVSQSVCRYRNPDSHKTFLLSHHWLKCCF